MEAGSDHKLCVIKPRSLNVILPAVGFRPRNDIYFGKNSTAAFPLKIIRKNYLHFSIFRWEKTIFFKS